MPDKVTTTHDKFPVINITHKPRRMQGDNLEVEDLGLGEVKENNLSPIPRALTVENAITFYESQATGELAKLYTQTAKWLRELLSRKSPTVELPDSDIESAKEFFDKIK